MPLAESIREELIKVFTEPQADVLASCVVRAHDTLATRSDMHELRVAMRELADQQRQTSSEVQDLARHQKETSAEVRDLARQQKETSAELKQLAGAVSELAVQQKETSAEVRDLARQQKETSAELKQLAGTVSELAVQQKELSTEVRELAGAVRTLSIRTDTTAGWALEWLVGKHLPAYVGRRIRRCRIIGAMDLVESLEETQAAASLTADDIEELRRADVIATGTIDGGSIYLVGEVSFTADNDDILRAARRTAVMRKAGQQAQGFVACDAIDAIPAQMARREGVWVILKGRLLEPAA
jgi:DNA repair exonuclease SbcCD ATPase subunit